MLANELNELQMLISTTYNTAVISLVFYFSIYVTISW